MEYISCNMCTCDLLEINTLGLRPRARVYISGKSLVPMLQLLLITHWLQFCSAIYIYIALATVLCSIAQVPVAKTTTIPHLIGGKTLHRSLEFFYSLTCKGRLWAITSPIRVMFTSSQWRSKKPTWVAGTLVYIYINVLIHLTSLVPS